MLNKAPECPLLMLINSIKLSIGLFAQNQGKVLMWIHLVSTCHSKKPSFSPYIPSECIRKHSSFLSVTMSCCTRNFSQLDSNLLIQSCHVRICK